AVSLRDQFRPVPNDTFGRIMRRWEVAQRFMRGQLPALFQSAWRQAAAVDAIGEPQQESGRAQLLPPDCGVALARSATCRSEPKVALVGQGTEDGKHVSFMPN